MKTESVLIVDDEEGYRKVLSNYLKELGYQTMAVKDGLEALRVIVRKRYPLIILDIKMPELNGNELLNVIQEMPYDPYVIIITAYPGAISLKDDAAKGVRKIITKPFSVDEIKSCLDEFKTFKKAEGDL